MELAVMRDGDEVRFSVVVSPRAARTEVAGVHDGALRVRITAAPVDGAANRALCALLAKRLGVARGAVRVRAGQRGRRKTVSVVGVDYDMVRGLAEAP